MAPKDIHSYVEQIIGHHLHAKQVLSLANGVVGTIHSASLAIAAIGTGLAMAEGLLPKHAVKQVDRLLSNVKVDPEVLRTAWVTYIIGQREEVAIVLDWTEFDPDDHATIAAYLLTGHGRATPLMWKTVSKKTLKRRRNATRMSFWSNSTMRFLKSFRLLSWRTVGSATKNSTSS